ncbi:MAG: hypothetical protein ACI3YK_02825 [Eubacteriales bacterium]
MDSDSALTSAHNTSHAFSLIAKEQDLRDIDGIRKHFTASLTEMGRLIDFLRGKTALFAGLYQGGLQ